jgi:hypothetical protein
MSHTVAVDRTGSSGMRRGGTHTHVSTPPRLPGGGAGALGSFTTLETSRYRAAEDEGDCSDAFQPRRLLGSGGRPRRAGGRKPAVAKAATGSGRATAKRGGGGSARARSHCRFVPPRIHFIPDSPAYSVPLCVKRQCNLTLGRDSARRAAAAREPQAPQRAAHTSGDSSSLRAEAAASAEQARGGGSVGVEAEQLRGVLAQRSGGGSARWKRAQRRRR